jgi:hypothetical protein
MQTATPTREPRVMPKEAPSGPMPVPVIMDVGPLPLDPEAELAMIEKRATLHKRKIMALIGLTHQTDWTKFEKKGQGWVWEMGRAGCARIMQALGLGVRNVAFEKCTLEDGGYLYTYTGEIYDASGRAMFATGSCSTSKSFHRGGEGNRKAIASIDEANIKKDAYSNFLSHAVKDFVGFGKMGEDTVTEYFDSRGAKTGKVTYAQGAQGGSVDTPEDREIRAKIDALLAELYGGNKAAAADKLEELTAFKGKSSGQDYPGVRDSKELTGKRLKVAYGKVKDHYESVIPEDHRKEAAPAPATPASEPVNG